MPADAAVPTPALPQPVIIIASPIADGPRPTPAAVVAAVLPANVTRRAIVVYGAADLASAIGAVEAGRSYQVLAKSGADWLQVDMSGSGVVFVRPADLFDIPADLADLQPTEEPAVIYVASQPQAAPADPPSDWYTDIATPPPGFVESLIGSDPNALACGGSPLCGGLTNAQAQAARDRQRAGQ